MKKTHVAEIVLEDETLCFFMKKLMMYVEIMVNAEGPCFGWGKHTSLN